MRTIPFIVLLSWVMFGADGAPKVAFDASGTIRFADKALAMTKGHLYYSVAGKELINIYPIWSAPGQGYGEAGYGDSITTHGYDAAAKEFIVKATLPKASDAKYEIRVKVLDDGLVHYRISWPELGDLKSKALQVRFPAFTLDGTTIRDENEDIIVEKFEGERKSFMLPKGMSPEFFAENPDRAVRFSIIKHDAGQTRYGISDARHDKGLPRMEYRPAFSKENEIELTIDIRKISAERAKSLSTETVSEYDSIGIGKFNRMELPNFGASANLIQNPSAEEGLHGWDTVGGSRITNLEHLREWLIVDDSTAYHGKKSFRFQMRPSYSAKFNTTMNLIAPYSMQLKVGKSYTFSFYAKTDHEGLAVGCVAWGAKAWGKWLGHKSFPLTKEWKRYSTTFTATESLTTVMFGVPWWFDSTYQGVKETTHFWADAFQFEEASSPTPFTLKPLSVTADKMKTYFALKEEKQLSYELVNNTDNDRTVDCVMSVRDFFKNEIAAKVFSGVTVPANGRAPLVLSAAKEMSYIGYYTVRIAIEDKKNNYRDYDFYSVPVIDPFSKAELTSMKNRLMFTFGNFVGGDLERNTRILREIGVGGIQPQMYPISEGTYAIIDKEGILQFTGLFGNDPRNMYIADPDEKAVVEPMWKLKSFDSPEYTAYTNFLKNVYLPKYKHFKYIKYYNEPHTTMADEANIFSPKMMAKFYSDIYPIIKSVIPDAKVISCDPANIGDGTRKWHEAVLNAGGLKYIDILAGHPYREKPERPDLESDYEELIAVADRTGFKGDIWCTEAGNHPMLKLPGFGNAEARFAPVTSDAPGVRPLIAYNIRYVIMTMKYASRIKMFLNWTTALTMNYLTGTPSPVAAEYNAAARALGNASFVRDFKYGDGVKTYLFDNGAGKGIAAIWDFDDKLENGERKANRFRLYAKSGAQAADLFGRAMKNATRDGDYLYFDLDYVPALMTAPDVKTLADALERSGVQYEATEQIASSVGLDSYTALSLNFKNRGTSAFAGTAKINLGGTARDLPLAVKALSDASVRIPIDDVVDTSTARYSIAMPITILDGQGKVLKEIPERRYHSLFCSRKRSDIVIDGDLSDWKGYRFGVVGQDDFDVIEYVKGAHASFDDLGARFFAAWDEDALYLAVEVRDDVHHQPNTLGGTWAGDSVQLFIDAFRDGQETSLNMQDDYAYAIAKTSAGDQVYRAISADRQLSWLDIQNNVLEPNVEVKIGRDEIKKRTVYELRFPAKYIAPVALKKGNAIGLGIMVNDSDGDKRKTAITTCDGKEGWLKPYYLSFFYFE